MHVKEAMTPSLIGVPETATLWDALRALMSARISALVVFDETGAPAGILSEGDLLRRAEIGTQAKRPGWLDFLLGGGRAAESYVHGHGRRISEIMTHGVISIDEEADLSEAVDLILARGIKRLVVTRRGQAVGILSRFDLLKTLMDHLPDSKASRTDAQIRVAIEGEIDRQPWAPRGSVRVAVEKGVVTYEGAITDNRLREGLRVLAENTPGVAQVRDRIAWIEPNSGYLVPAEDMTQGR
jgi:CBS domain-containing protein